MTSFRAANAIKVLTFYRTINLPEQFLIFDNFGTLLETRCGGTDRQDMRAYRAAIEAKNTTTPFSQLLTVPPPYLSTDNPEPGHHINNVKTINGYVFLEVLMVNVRKEMLAENASLVLKN